MFSSLFIFENVFFFPPFQASGRLPQRHAPVLYWSCATPKAVTTRGWSSSASSSSFSTRLKSLTWWTEDQSSGTWVFSQLQYFGIQMILSAFKCNKWNNKLITTKQKSFRFTGWLLYSWEFLVRRGWFNESTDAVILLPFHDIYLLTFCALLPPCSLLILPCHPTLSSPLSACAFSRSLWRFVSWCAEETAAWAGCSQSWINSTSINRWAGGGGGEGDDDIILKVTVENADGQEKAESYLLCKCCIW